MAIQNVPSHARYSFTASTAGLQQYQFCSLTTTGQLAVPATGVFAVVLDDAPSLAVSTVGTGGVETGGYTVGAYYGCVLGACQMKVIAGATLNAGVAIMTSATGTAIAAAAVAGVVLGYTLNACSSGDITNVWLTGGYHA